MQLIHKKGEGRLNRTRQQRVRSKNRAWARMIVHLPEMVKTATGVEKNWKREQFIELAGDILKGKEAF